MSQTFDRLATALGMVALELRAMDYNRALFTEEPGTAMRRIMEESTRDLTMAYHKARETAARTLIHRLVPTAPLPDPMTPDEAMSTLLLVQAGGYLLHYAEDFLTPWRLEGAIVATTGDWEGHPIEVDREPYAVDYRTGLAP